MADKSSKVITELEKYYDKDDFKGGLKFATKALAKEPKSGPILAYKALFMFKLKQEGAMTVANDAIKLNMRSATTWKVSGVINKESGEYVKAMQCFTQSFRIDPNDNCVVNELCHLSLMNQNYKQYVDYVRSYMDITKQPSTVASFAVGLALQKKYDAAIQVLQSLESNLMPSNSPEEMAFRDQAGRLHAHLLIRDEKYQQCLDYVKSCPLIQDKISVMEDEATCFEKLGQKDKMIEKVHELLKEYPDNGDYFAYLERNMTTEEYVAELIKIKEEIKSKYAHVRILEIIPVSDERFMPLLAEHITPLLKKGSPAIFATIADFTPEKIDVALKFAQEQEVSISSQPILHVFAAQVYLSKKEYEKAIKECDEGIKINPTVVELYVTKINVLQRYGKQSEALEVAKILSSLDPADRNSNNTYVRMLYRNGFMKTARVTAEPFSIDQKKNTKLFKNQFNKLHFRAARCALRAGDIENALNFYKDCSNHYDKYISEQLVIMNWAARRPKSFLDMQEWSEGIVSLKQNCKAFANIARILLQSGDMAALKPYVLKMKNSTNQEALAYMCVYYALNKLPIPALKCFKKLTGKYYLMALPAMKVAAKDAEAITGVAKDVFFEEYKPEDIEAKTAEELLYKARGFIYVGDKAAAKDILLAAAASAEMSYPVSVDINLAAKVEMKDAELATALVNKIHEKYPMYEIEYAKYESDEPHKFDSKPEQ